MTKLGLSISLATVDFETKVWLAMMAMNATRELLEKTISMGLA